jgi:two-component system, NarL family, sensor histidine kinase UhpB
MTIDKAASQLNYQDLFETTSEIIAVLDNDAYLIDCNMVLVRLLGYETKAALFNKRINDLIATPYREKEEKEFVRQANERGFSDEFEENLLCGNGNIVPVRIKLLARYNNVGKTIGFWLIGRDISELMRVEEAARERESQYRVLFETSPDAILLTDRDGIILFSNRKAAELFRFEIEEDLIGKKVLEIATFDDLQMFEVYLQSLKQSGLLRDVEFPIHRKDGTFLFIEASVSLVEASKALQPSFVIVLRDVTERKKSEAERQFLLQRVISSSNRLQLLGGRLFTIQEEERRRVSRELHDESGQSLTALTLMLKMLQADLPSDSHGMHERMDDAVALAEKTAHDLRIVAQDLRPPALDTLGLNLTLEGYCRQYSHRSNIEVIYKGENTYCQSETNCISFYRFLQEALTNISKHAKASQVLVEFYTDEDFTYLSVSDNGIGFDAKEIQDPQGDSAGLGLLGMKERFELLKGRLVIESIPGKGSRLVAGVPRQLPIDS